ncbi:MAG: hypothetical protein ABIQ81_07680 [Novosphingobium sp.]
MPIDQPYEPIAHAYIMGTASIHPNRSRHFVNNNACLRIDRYSCRRGSRAGVPKMMKKHDWLGPSIILTAAPGAAVLLAIPDHGVLWAAMTIYPAWIAAAAIIASVCLFVRMVRLGVTRPALELQRMIVDDRDKLALSAVIILLAGLNMIAFMWIKPLLNYLVPFQAGPWLANIDRVLFLGHDPWTLLTWLNFPAAGLIYHPAWLVVIILALLMVAWAPASPKKSAMLLTYFVLWSLIGPAIHSLLPAAGPLFFERLGNGPRFAGLHQWPETRQVADYLWATTPTASSAPAAGFRRCRHSTSPRPLGRRWQLVPSPASSQFRRQFSR